MPADGPSTPDVSPTRRFVLVGGVLSLPFSLLGYWQTGSELSFDPVLLGGIVAGYLAKQRTGRTGSVGIHAGVVGGLPLLWLLFDVLTAPPGLAGPPWFVASASVLAVVVGHSSSDWPLSSADSARESAAGWPERHLAAARRHQNASP
jgi:hypothetical protein